MSDTATSDTRERGDEPGKTRTWWHPLLARLLDYVLATGYSVFEEVLVGKLPLRVDILLIRRLGGQLSEAAQRDLSALVPLLKRFTLIEFKGPTDALEPGDLAQLIGCAFLWHSQQAEGIPHQDVSLIVLAPAVTEAFRNDLRLLGCRAEEHEPGVFGISGLPFAAFLVETDAMARRGQPILSLVSHVFLDERQRIMEELNRTGHGALLCYVLQQVRQFRKLGEDFAMQHKDSEYLGQLSEELEAAVLETIPPERVLRRYTPDEVLRRYTPDEVLRRYTPDEVLRRYTPEQRLRGMSAEDVAGGLNDEELARLRDILERRPGK